MNFPNVLLVLVLRNIYILCLNLRTIRLYDAEIDYFDVFLILSLSLKFELDLISGC